MTAYSLGDIEPRLSSDASDWIAPNAYVIGDIELGKNVGVWFHAVLRGDNEPIVIGDNTNLQEHAVLHTDMGFPLSVGENCTIGHRALLHGCTIGDNTLIGMGAMIMNGAKIGNNCLIGANALITEGKVIPDGSLVMGAPGKVIRELSAQDIEALTKSAKHYVLAMRRMRDEMKPFVRS